MGVSYKKDGNRVDMGIKIGTVLSSEVWNEGFNPRTYIRYDVRLASFEHP